MLRLLVAILATWRIAAFLCYDYSFEWLRQRVGVDFEDDEGRPLGVFARILSCFWCTSFWVGAVVAFLPEWALLPFALSGGSIILNHWTRIVRDVQRE